MTRSTSSTGKRVARTVRRPCPKCHSHGYTEYMPEQSRVMAAEPCECINARAPDAAVDHIKPVNGSGGALMEALNIANAELCDAHADIEAQRQELALRDTLLAQMAEALKAYKAAEDYDGPLEEMGYRALSHDARHLRDQALKAYEAHREAK